MTSNFTPPTNATSSALLLNILNCTNTVQLADFCSLAVPSIWGSIKQQQPLKRTIAFKQYCQKVIKATQISCACVILGLYYIQRLRSAYPFIHASMGSEVRLFTTALVLANKYLDDNTFTNKTWSEVSSIPVLELNIMEMEFLSALQYNIHLPHDQFFQWVSQCQQWIVPNTLNMQPRSVKLPVPTVASPTAAATLPSAAAILPSASASSLLSSPATSTGTSSSMPRTPSHSSTPNLKRSYHDSTLIDEHYPQQYKKRPSSNNGSYLTNKMPYTPPESFQPIPAMYSTAQSYPTPTYTSHDYLPHLPSSLSSSSSSSSLSSSTLTSSSSFSLSSGMNDNNNNDCCRPILSWSSSTSALLASSRHPYSLPLPASALSAPVNASLYSTSLLATRVRCLEID